jgi:hypothetical protein
VAPTLKTETLKFKPADDAAIAARCCTFSAPSIYILILFLRNLACRGGENCTKGASVSGLADQCFSVQCTARHPVGRDIERSGGLTGGQFWGQDGRRLSG